MLPNSQQDTISGDAVMFGYTVMAYGDTDLHRVDRAHSCAHLGFIHSA